MHKTQYKKRRIPFNPMKQKILRFAPEKQPHAKTCDCSNCIQYQRVLCKLIGAKELTKRNNPENAGFFMRKALPDHVVRRRLLGKCLRKW